MDNHSAFLNSFAAWLRGVDEDVLVAASNKGLYRRSLKDLEEGLTPTVSPEADRVRVVWPDGTECALTADLKGSTCGCPSRTLCRHRIAAILFLQQHAAEFFGAAADEVQEMPAADFSAIRALSVDDLLRRISARELQDIIFRMKHYGLQVAFEEKAALLVTFPESGIRCHFPAEHPLERSHCSCKSERICLHRVEALLHYLQQCQRVTLAELEIRQEGEVEAEWLQPVRNRLERILQTGLARLADTAPDDLEQLAIAAGAHQLPALEHALRGLQTELRRYLDKQAGFAPRHALNRIARLMRQLDILVRKGTLFADMVGESRSAYVEIPPVKLAGLGAEAWQTASGYAGITYYFFQEAQGRWFTYTQARPLFYDNARLNLHQAYQGELPWNLHTSLKELSRAVVTLHHAKINAEFRLSGSQETQGIVSGASDFRALRLDGVLFDQWDRLLQAYEPHFASWFFGSDRQAALVMLKIARWGASRFDQTTQRFACQLFDSAGKALRLEIAYSPISNNLIQRLEQAEQRGTLPEYLLARLYFIEREGLAAYPITAYAADSSLSNWTIE